MSCYNEKGTEQEPFLYETTKYKSEILISEDKATKG